MKLSYGLHEFFDRYLPRIKGVSAHTVKAYRDTFTLFLPFAAKSLSTDIESLTIQRLSPRLILDFLDHLETERSNIPRTRNLRLATLKSLAKMIRLMYPEQKEIADRILSIPQKRTQKLLIGFLSQEEILKVFAAVDLRKKEGFRDYTLLHLLFDSGARASEIATLNLDYFDLPKRTLSILGKGNRYRLIELWPKTAQLINCYIANYRATPKPWYRHRLFINQRGEELTRYGIHRLCQKYLARALPEKRFKDLSPAHSFRHSCAVNLLRSGKAVTDIKNHLGHENIQSTMVYLQMDLSRRQEIQKKFIEYTQSILTSDSKINELIDWENKEKTLTWLDTL
jgi:site-specific recombinase XerD